MGKDQQVIPIKVGDILVCDTLSWHEGWEFDHPSMMLAPVIRCYEDSSNHERIVESVMIDAVIAGELKPQNFVESWAWRGFNLDTLRRRFRESLGGKRFPKACYMAERTYVRVTLDEDGELSWEDVDTATVLGNKFIDKVLA